MVSECGVRPKKAKAMAKRYQRAYDQYAHLYGEPTQEIIKEFWAEDRAPLDDLRPETRELFHAIRDMVDVAPGRA
jgi:hypothetical protein